MKSIFVLFFVFSLYSCGIASLAGTAVSTTAKVVEMPFKTIGSVFRGEEEDKEEEKEED